MTIALWVVQFLLAGLFLTSGILKATMSKDRLIATGQTGVAPFPLPVIRFTAVCEILAAIGLVLPGLVGVGEVFTPLAAVGLMIVMVGAALSHASLREFRQVGANAVLFALALFVAIGRF
jgi:uncharacterized membrane protein YphA (DoxX/SURF4 family)